MNTDITPAELEKRGFKRDQMLGYVRTLSVGPGHGENGESHLDLVVSNSYPFNGAAITLVADGYGMVANGPLTLETVDSLIRLFDQAAIDHPDVAWIGPGDLDDDGDEE